MKKREPFDPSHLRVEFQLLSAGAGRER